MRYMYNWLADDNQTSFIEKDWSFTAITRCIQLFWQRLSHESVKAYATLPIGIMGSYSLA